MDNIQISPEYSTQPKKQRPNPMLQTALNYLGTKLDNFDELTIADQGCGALRHLELLLESYNHVILVDTKAQLSRKHTLDGLKTTIPEYIGNLELNGKSISVIDSSEFGASKLDLHVIFNVCTFDVVLPEIRAEIIDAAKQNLRDKGYFILIIPRNDCSIICRCKDDNKLSDGHYFHRYGKCTYYTNFKKYNGLIDTLSARGFVLERDLSIYRYVCLVLRNK